ncbi:MAG: hypothetical protein M1337_08950 [Actinobacteria bacterium]|nr:hypothetical protein [Actinomycetota bacterium]
MEEDLEQREVPFDVRLAKTDLLTRAIGNAIVRCRRSCPQRVAESRSAAASGDAAVEGESVPFAAARMPHDTVIEIIERMSVQGLTLYEAADEYGFAAEVVEMELARQRGRYNRELLRRSGWRQVWSSG